MSDIEEKDSQDEKKKLELKLGTKVDHSRIYSMCR